MGTSLSRTQVKYLVFIIVTNFGCSSNSEGARLFEMEYSAQANFVAFETFHGSGRHKQNPVAKYWLKLLGRNSSNQNELILDSKSVFS